MKFYKLTRKSIFLHILLITLVLLFHQMKLVSSSNQDNLGKIGNLPTTHKKTVRGNGKVGRTTLPKISQDLVTEGNETKVSEQDQLSYCAIKHKAMVKCVSEILPLVVNFGIPSDRHELEMSCKTFKTSMDCMAEWVNECQNEEKANEFNAYIAPAVEMYSILCRNTRSRAQFYRHGSCFKKISDDFDTCVNRLGANLRRLYGNDNNQSTKDCCHRHNLLKCTVRVLEFHNCKVDSMTKILQMSEYLVEFRSERENQTKIHCLLMTENDCKTILGPVWDSYVPSTSKGVASSKIGMSDAKTKAANTVMIILTVVLTTLQKIFPLL